MAHAPARTAARPPALLQQNDEGGDSLAIGLTRAEVDQQIETARRYPRSITGVQKRVTELATLDEETAKEMIYARPQAGEVIRGPSIRFAELLFQSWGNARAAARTVHVDKTFVEAEGIYHDLETNTATVMRVRRRIIKKNGDRYPEDQILITANAAASIAKRNAILGGIPKPIWRESIGKVEALLKGDVKTLGARRKALLDYLDSKGVDRKRVFQTLELGGEADIGLDHMLTLHGLAAALKEGEGTIDELFPLPASAKATPAKAALGEKLQGGGNGTGFDRDRVHAGIQGHDPDTGEVIEGESREVADIEKDKPQDTDESDEAATGDEVLEGDDIPDSLKGGDANEDIMAGHAKPGEGYFMRGDPVDNGRRQTYKDGKPFSTTAKNDLPIFAEHPPALSPSAGVDAADEAEEETAAKEEPAATGAIAEFQAAVRAANDWASVKPALVGLYRSDEWKALGEVGQTQVRAWTWEAVEGIKKATGDPVDQAADPSAFRLWMDTQDTSDGADAIEGTFRVLQDEAKFKQMNEANQTMIANSVKRRCAELRGEEA